MLWPLLPLTTGQRAVSLKEALSASHLPTQRWPVHLPAAVYCGDYLSKMLVFHAFGEIFQGVSLFLTGRLEPFAFPVLCLPSGSCSQGDTGAWCVETWLRCLSVLTSSLLGLLVSLTFLMFGSDAVVCPQLVACSSLFMPFASLPGALPCSLWVLALQWARCSTHAAALQLQLHSVF